MSTENQDTEKSTANMPIQAGALTQLLSQYRTDARLGHEQVSEALCLPVSSVRALENEEFDKLPEAPYIRGYLRTYARLANRDANEAIKIYDTLHGGTSNTTTHYYATKDAEKNKKSTFSESGMRLVVLAIFLSILGLLTMHPTINQWLQNTWNSFSSEETTPSDNKLPGDNLIDPKALAGDIPGNLPVSDKLDEPKKPATTTNNSDDATSSSNTNNSTTDANTTTTTEETTDNSSNENDATTTETASQTDDATNNNSETAENNEQNETEDNTNTAETGAVEEGKVKIKLVFSDEVWLRIRNEKRKTVFEALNPPGTEKELVLTPPLKLKVGSAHGLKIYVNGKEKDITQYTKGSIARFDIEKEESAATETTNSGASTNTNEVTE